MASSARSRTSIDRTGWPVTGSPSTSPTPALCPASTADDTGERLERARQRLRDKLGAETSEEGEEVEIPEQRDESEPQEQTDSQQEQINERNQSGAAEREDHSDLDPAQVQDPNQSNW